MKARRKHATPQLPSALRRDRPLPAGENPLRPEVQARQVERERLRMAEQGGQVSVFDWNLKTGEIFSTGELEKLFGLASGERVDCYANWAGLVHPEDLARLEADWAAWPQSGRREHRWTYRLVRPDGQVRWLEARAEVLRDAAGEPWRMVGTQADITERRQRAESPQQTEEGFRALLELAPDAMLVHQEGRLVFVNAAAVRFFGARGPEELLGRSALELVHPQERASVQVRARRVLVRGGTVERKERRMVRLDGQPVLGETAVGRVNWEGRPAVLVSVRDITERKQVEEALHRSQRLLQDILDGATNLIFVKDLERRFILVNRAFEETVGKRREELLGRTDHEVFPQCWADYYAEHDRQVMAAGKPVQIEELSPTTAENERFFLSNKFPLLDEQGQCYGLCCIAMEISERKRMEQALHLTREQLTQANQQLEETVQARTAELSRAVTELQQFSHAIIHDLRAPLRAVHSFVALMKQGCTECHTPRSLEFMDQVQTAVGRMDDLITDALSYARVVQQKLPLHPVNLDALIGDLIQSYPHLQPSEAEIRVEGPLPVVRGNTAGLVQCFSNLLSNAVKFVAPGARPRVRLWSEPRQEFQRIWVEDNGIGIPPEHQPQLFGMFCRLHPEHYEGTGIGLAVVHKVVERMGGRVGVESAAGQGSRFWVELQSAA